MNFKLLRIKSYLFIVIAAVTFGCATKYGAHFQRTSEHDKRFQRSDQVNSNSNSNSNSNENLLSIDEDIPVKTVIENEPNYNNDQTGAVASIRREVIISSPIKEHVKKYKQKIESVKEINLDNRSFNKEVRKAKRELNKEIKSTIKREIKEAKKQGADDDYILMMVLAFLIPPLGVGLTYGITNEFWISLILTLLFWLPGAIYSLIMVHQHFKGSIRF